MRMDPYWGGKLWLARWDRLLGRILFPMANTVKNAAKISHRTQREHTDKQVRYSSLHYLLTQAKPYFIHSLQYDFHSKVCVQLQNIPTTFLFETNYIGKFEPNTLWILTSGLKRVCFLLSICFFIFVLDGTCGQGCGTKHIFFKLRIPIKCGNYGNFSSWHMVELK